MAGIGAGVIGPEDTTMFIDPGFRIRTLLAALLVTAAALVGLAHASVDADDAAPCPDVAATCGAPADGPT